jgi:hypothetical protein
LQISAARSFAASSAKIETKASTRSRPASRRVSVPQKSAPRSRQSHYQERTGAASLSPRCHRADRATPFDTANIINGVIMTFVLLTSSLTMLGAVIAAKQGRKSTCIQWLSATVALGLIFAALHLRE